MERKNFFIQLYRNNKRINNQTLIKPDNIKKFFHCFALKILRIAIVSAFAAQKSAFGRPHFFAALI